MNKNKCFSLYSQFKNQPVEKLSRDSRVLIIDGLNSFIRVFGSMPSTNDNGEHNGGYIGFLRSIALQIRNFQPTRCICIFDGKGGSLKRKSIHEGYKAGRTIQTKFNRQRDLPELSIEEEIAAMKFQMGRLGEYLQVLPITTISIDLIEADDVIAYLTTEVFEQLNSEVIIMSDDKDFLQLVNDKVSVWRPVEKKYYSKQQVFEKFGIPAHNYIHYKVFMGDGSDNISGIKGIGIKSLQKNFPLLFSDKIISCDELLDYCKDNISKHKVYQQVIDAEAQIRLSWRLMYLRDLEISGALKEKIRSISEGEIPKLDTFSFKKMFLEDRAYSTINDVEYWLKDSFTTLNLYSGK